MTINATLIIQAINFFIAYLLFRYFFLQPVYALIQKDDQYQNTLDQKIKKGRELVAQKESDKEAQLVVFHQSIQGTLPEQKRVTGVDVDIEGVAPALVITQKELDAVSGELASSIVNEVDHVRA